MLMISLGLSSSNTIEIVSTANHPMNCYNYPHTPAYETTYYTTNNDIPDADWVCPYSATAGYYCFYEFELDYIEGSSVIFEADSYYGATMNLYVYSTKAVAVASFARKNITSSFKETGTYPLSVEIFYPSSSSCGFSFKLTEEYECPYDCPDCLPLDSQCLCPKNSYVTKTKPKDSSAQTIATKTGNLYCKTRSQDDDEDISISINGSNNNINIQDSYKKKRSELNLASLDTHMDESQETSQASYIMVVIFANVFMVL
jgi:hypothetical protein